jgi:alpha-amylase|tara:strand:+ start:13645 stop:13845 length:201 start_codon:yes stop_codon:yes gene_type:complete
MNVGRQHAGETWTDVLDRGKSAVQIDGDGVGRLLCKKKTMACFINEAAIGRARFSVVDVDVMGLVG